MSSLDHDRETTAPPETPADQSFDISANSNGVESNGKSPATRDAAEVRQAIKDFLAFRSKEAPAELPQDQPGREAILLKLLAAMAVPAVAGDPDESKPVAREQERARQLFIEYGLLDQAIDNLRAHGEPTKRAEAAHLLGLVRSQRGTAPLIAALFDEVQEVRDAATAALSEIGDPAVSMDPPGSALNSDTNSMAHEPGQTNLASTLESLFADNEMKTEGGSESGEDELDLPDDPELIRKQIETLESRLLDAVTARDEAERDVRLRIEQEASIRADAAARRHEDEESRKRAEEKATRRRYEDERKLSSEQLGRARAEIAAHELAEKEVQLRMQFLKLRTFVQGREREQLEIQTVESARANAAELAEAALALREATEQHATEIDSLRREEELLRTASAEAALRRGEAEAARRRNEIDTQQLLEEQARLLAADAACRDETERVREAEAKLRHDQEELVRRSDELRRQSETAATRRHELDVAQHRAEEEEQQLFDLEVRTRGAEDSRRQAQAERMRLESEIRQRLQTEQHLLEEVRSRASEQEDNLAESARQRAEEHQRRRAELESLRERLDIDVQRRTEQEHEIITRIENLRSSEAELRKRIEDLEVRRGTAERTHSLVAEQAQRMEAEAHLTIAEEERALAKLEEVRRNVAQQAQSRADQEERIKREIESIRSLEEEHKRRFEVEIQKRADAEMRLQHEKDRLRTAEEARVKGQARLELLATQAAPDLETSDWYDDPTANLRRIEPVVAAAQQQVGFSSPWVSSDDQSAQVIDTNDAASDPDAVLARLTSAEVPERAAALADVPALGVPDAFQLIVKHFDDPAEEVRNSAARSLREIDPLRPVDPFTRALEEASTDRRRNIGLAIASSGLAAQALNDLDAESREDTYNALCLLFVMAKTGEVKPLVDAIETHPDVEVRRAAIKLLNLSGQSELAEAAAKRRLGLGRTNGL